MRSFFDFNRQRKVVPSVSKHFERLNKVFVWSILISLFLISFQGTSQTKNITYTASNTALSKVFEDISKKYKIKFAYDAEVFGKIKASFSFKNEPFNKVAEYLGNKYLLEFRLIESTWIVVQKRINQPLPEIPPKPVPLPVMAKKQLSGYVIDQVTGEPLNYCSIVFPNNRGTVTNELGFFYIETSSGSVSFYIDCWRH